MDIVHVAMVDACFVWLGGYPDGLRRGQLQGERVRLTLPQPRWLVSRLKATDLFTHPLADLLIDLLTCFTRLLTF